MQSRVPPYAGVVEKLSAKGLSFNKRLLILNGEILAYYSKVPPEASTEGFELMKFLKSGAVPKAQMKVNQIISIQQADEKFLKKKKKKYIFILEFPKTPSETEAEIRELGEKNKMKWIFAVAQTAEFSKWLNYLKAAKAFQSKPHTDERLVNRQATEQEERKNKENERAATFAMIPNNEEEVIVRREPLQENPRSLALDDSPSPSRKKSPKKPLPIPTAEMLKLDLSKSIESLPKKEEEIKMPEPEPEKIIPIPVEEDPKVKKEQEKEKRKNDLKERNPTIWEFTYNNFLAENLKTLEDFNSQMTTGFQLFHYIGDFRTKAKDTCKSIIDELHLPPSDRKHQAKEFSTKDENSDIPEKIFILNNCIIRITWPLKKFQDLSDGTDAEVCIDKISKGYGNEFRASNCLNNICYQLNKKNEAVTWRIPLSVVVDYKGFRCLVVSTPPINSDETLMHGPLWSENSFRYSRALEEDLKFIAKSLNIKEHKFSLDEGKDITIHLSILAEVHQVKFDPDAGELKKKTIQREKTEMMECKYLMKTSEIFPVDVDIETKYSGSFLKRLRPEFVAEYNKPLSSDAFMTNPATFESEKDDLDVASAGTYLRNQVISNMLKKLESLEIIPIDSKSLTGMFHSYGLNMRYLGVVQQKCSLPHIKDICLVEMIARSSKKILRKALTDIFISNQDENALNEKKIPIGNNVESPTKKLQKPVKTLAKIESEVADAVLDFLTLLFGTGPESEGFWKILEKQIIYDFSFSLKKIKRDQILYGALLHAVIYHCDVNLSFNKDIISELGKTLNPFRRENYNGMKVSSKVYTMDNLDVKLVGDKYKEAKDMRKYELAIKSCIIAQSLEKYLSYRGEYNGDTNLLGDLAEIYFESGDLAQANIKVNEGISKAAPLHAEAIKCLCVLMRIQMAKNDTKGVLETFNEALLILEFHLGKFHPLYSTIYSILGYYYVEKGKYQEALTLYRSSLTCCSRILGPNHQFTGEVYIDLADLTMKMNLKEEALSYYEKAYLIFTESKGEESIEAANSAFEMASLLLMVGKIKDSMIYAMKSLKIFEKDEASYIEKILETSILVCQISEIVKDSKTAVDYSDKIWGLLNRHPISNHLYYKSKILTIVLNNIISNMPIERRTMISRIYDGIIGVLKKEGLLNKLSGGTEDKDLQRKYLDDLSVKSQIHLNVQNLLNHTLNQLYIKGHENNLRGMFDDYREYLEELDDITCRE